MKGSDSPDPFFNWVDPRGYVGEAAGDDAGEAAGDEAGEAGAAGEVTTGVFEFGEPLGALPNQFHRVNPKNKRTRTSSAMSAAAMPAPAPAVSLVSTTSEPAGLQYLRTLYPPAPKSAARTITTRIRNSSVPKPQSS